MSLIFYYAYYVRAGMCVFTYHLSELTRSKTYFISVKTYWHIHVFKGKKTLFKDCSKEVKHALQRFIHKLFNYFHF